jgi:hypothetical protein
VSFPKPHLFLVGALSLGILSLVASKFDQDDTTDRFSTDSVLRAIPDSVPAGADELLPDQTISPAETVLVPIADEFTAAVEPVEVEQTLTISSTTVNSGDNLAKIFKREGIPQSDLALLLQSKHPPGTRIHFRR